MNRVSIALFGSIILLVGLLYLLQEPATDRSKSSLTLFCAASNRAVVEKIRADYEREIGIEVVIQYGPSQSLLSSAEVSGTGDLYLPADESYLELGREKGLVEEIFPLARMQAGLVVRKGNPGNYRTLEDIVRDGVKLVQADPEVAAVGKMTRKILGMHGSWDRIHAATMAYRTTVTDVANDVKLGAADVGIVFDAVLSTYPGLEFVPIPELAEARADSAVGILKSSKNPSAALHFARYLSAADRGLKQYAEAGFKPVEGDPWDDIPEIEIFAGAMLRPAVDLTIQEFAKREGVNVSTIYNGCGILVGQIKTGQHPDAYFACDAEFLTQVRQLFGEPLDVSANELVILVQKGNPHNIVSLRDLSKPELRVGIGHEKQCAMGWLTQQTLIEGGVQSEVMPNVVVQSATGDLLVNKMNAGALDAAVAYISNAAGSADKLDAVRITGLTCAVATQPFAIGKETKHRQLMLRLQKQILSSASQERFVNEGFHWNSQQ